MNVSPENESGSIKLLERREFVSAALKTAAISMVLTMPGMSGAAGLFTHDKEYTVQDVINIILKEIPGAPFKQTVDTIKSGSADQKISGIVTTMFATIDVIKQATQLHANFIIAHEPTFYNHTDDTNWVPNNTIVKQKQELLAKNKIAIWRFH